MNDDFIEQCTKILGKIFNGDEDCVQDGLEHIIKFSMKPGVTPKAACFFAKKEVFKKLSKRTSQGEYEVWDYSQGENDWILEYVSPLERDILLLESTEVAARLGITASAVRHRRRGVIKRLRSLSENLASTRQH